MNKTKTFPDAAVRGGAPNLQALLAAGADIHERDQKGRTALFRVCRVGHTEKALMLLAAGADPNATDHQGEAPLQSASRYGHLDCVRMLLQDGAAIDYCPPPSTTDATMGYYFDYSESALCSAVRKSPPAARLLLESGADPNAVTVSKKYPLLAAISAGDEEMVRLLLKHGAALEITNKQGRTPLHYAMEACKQQMIKLLLEAGADPNAKDDRGEPPVFEAILGYGSANLPALRQLLAAKPDLSVRNSVQDMTPLEWAIEVGQKEAAKLLREAGSPPPRPKEDEEGEIVITISAEDLGLKQEDLKSDDESDAVAEETEEEELVATAEDEAMLRRALQSKSSLLAYQGWRISPPHWQLLAAATELKPLVRLAYFARGHLNRPAGQEFQDGPEVLGESYQAAVDRFVAEGLLRRGAGAEAVALAVSATEFKDLAKENNLRSSGTKTELAELLCASLPPETWQKRLQAAGGYYELTEPGWQTLSEHASQLAGAELQLRNQVLSSLESRELERAAQTVRLLHLLLSRSRGQTYRLEAVHIAAARALLALPLPAWLSGEAARENRLSTILSAEGLCGQSGVTWHAWDAAFEPPKTPKGTSVPLDELVLYLLGNGRSYHGWAWEKEVSRWTTTADHHQ